MQPKNISLSTVHTLQVSERDKLGTGTLWNAFTGIVSEFQLSKIEVGQQLRLSTSSVRAKYELITS